jgi:1,4-alpha-glucan branching enzyme
MSDFKGYLSLVLHAHLPFIRHPEYEDFLEEDWFYQATLETYLPLLDIFERLTVEGVDFRLTMSITPPLCAMMSDELLIERFRKFLNLRIEFCKKELDRTKNTPYYSSAAMYSNKLNRLKDLYENYYGGNILNGFKKFQDMGKLEIITCCLTHGFLPLQIKKEAIYAQVKLATQDYKKHFGKSPRGIWLAECAYNPGDDEILRIAGIDYFFLETHGILYGTPRPRYGVYAPVYCKSGVAAFSRDTESAHQVWSAEHGYPGDYKYREFYRDVGYDLDYDYIKPYLHLDGVRRNVGIKYHSITGRVPLSSKEPYNPHQAEETAAVHAGNFLFNRERQIEHIHNVMGKKPILTSMYDAELFGHWWYEGPQFLEYLFRKIHYDTNSIKLITPSGYLKENPHNQVLTPSMSSWGDKGYAEVWLNGSNDWIYRHIHKATERMVELANKHPNASGVLEQALNQASRELMLAQSSDWAFLMTVGTAFDYSVKRTKEHLTTFNNLYSQISSANIDIGYLNDLRWKTNAFTNMDYSVFSSHNISAENLKNSNLIK